MSGKVLVTGHMGFIGVWAATLFKSHGWEVYGIDDRSSFGQRLYDVSNFEKPISSEIVADVSIIEDWLPWAKKIKPDLIVHLAGQAIVPLAFKEPYRTYRSNALGTLAILEAAKCLTTVSSAICITSDKVYENFNEDKPFQETDKLGGGDIYSVSKSSAELICKGFNNAHLMDRDLNIQTIRLGNVVGGGDWSINRLIPDLINAVKSEQNFKVRYMDATRPFQHISDVVNGIYKIAMAANAREIPSGEAWNLGPRENSFAFVRQVIDIFKSFYPELKVVDEEEKVKEDLRLQVNVKKYSEKFEAPRDNSIEAIHRTMRWYLDYYCGVDPTKLVLKDLEFLIEAV